MIVSSANSKLTKAIVEALGLGGDWRRIVIDIDYQDVVIIHVEMLLDENRLNIVPADVTGVKVIMSKDITE